MPDLLAVVDRALTRARRHAAILPGHDLGDDLARMIAMSATPLRGAVGVQEAWADRSTRVRGVALAVDTNAEASTTRADLELVEMAAADIAAAIESADLIAGHQLCSDLAVLTANAEPAAPAVLAAARRAWHARRTDPRSPGHRHPIRHRLRFVSSLSLRFCTSLSQGSSLLSTARPADGRSCD